MTVIFYLGGDSYPTEVDFEERFAQKIQHIVPRVFSQRSMFHKNELIQGGGRSIEERLSRLDALVGLFKSEQVILVGRSSGARVASRYATDHPVAAVICLAYPFQPLGEPHDPDRVMHLAYISTPTLIFQGVRDRYGGEEVVAKYPMSDAVEIIFIDADHEFGLTPHVFNQVCSSIKTFLGRRISQ